MSMIDTPSVSSVLLSETDRMLQDVLQFMRDPEVMWPQTNSQQKIAEERRVRMMQKINLQLARNRSSGAMPSYMDRIVEDYHKMQEDLISAATKPEPDKTTLVGINMDNFKGMMD